MRTRHFSSITAADLDRLHALVKEMNAPQKHVWRAQIVLLTVEGLGIDAIMRETAVQDLRLALAGMGFASTSRIPARPRSASASSVDVRRAARARPRTGPAQRWPGRRGVSISSVQRIWRAHGPAASRANSSCRTISSSSTKLRGVVGLYVDPPPTPWCSASRKEPNPGPRSYSGPACR